ncbi:arrestin domain-containing protein 4-like isoform X2 [Choristoneura fumiferana]|uniref:arrestin domain-containing protein 4-like isoform X2 n=1 Tax=Choristoneura fumiferana TaxID=7141 RepID=UPI003D15DA78
MSPMKCTLRGNHTLLEGRVFLVLPTGIQTHISWLYTPSMLPMGEHRLHPGKHEFPFTFPLPDNCPSSFEGEYGHIRYQLKVVVDRAFKFDQEKKISLRVIAPLDLNADPYAGEPIEMQFEDSYCCCCTSSGVCETFVKLPKAGYCPGQVIPIEVKCSNKGNVEIETIAFEIEQNTIFHASHHPGTKYDEATVAKLKKGPVPGNTTRTWTVEMIVPTMDIYNVATCRYIDIDYFFKVKVSPDGCHESSSQTRRFIIGNVPLRGYQDDVPNPMQDQMPKQNITTVEHYQTTPHFGPVVTQPMPNASPYPAPSPFPQPQPFPGANPPYPGGIAPYPGANPPYPGASPPYPAPNQSYPGASPYPNPPAPYPGASPYPGGAQPVSPYPPPYPGSGPEVPQLPPGAGVPLPIGFPSPFSNASAPGVMPPTPDTADNKNPMGDGASNPPYNPNYKG